MTLAAIVAVVVVLGAAALLVPRGRRTLIGVPLAALFVVVVLAAAAGRNQLGSEANKADPKAAFEKRCALAFDFTRLALYDAAARELEAALRAKPDGADRTACDKAGTALAAHGGQATGPGACACAAGSKPASTGDGVHVAKAAQHGTEKAGDKVLDRLVGGTSDARKVSLLLGPHGWLLLGGIALLLMAVWARVVFWFRWRVTTPAVELSPLVGIDGKVDGVVGLSAALRQELFEQDVKSPSVPAGTAADDLGGLIEASGVGGAKMLATLLAFLRKLFAPVNVVTVKGTQTGVAAGAADATKAVVLEMANKRTGETLAIETVQATSDRLLLRQIAVTVKSQALRRGKVALPPWQQWTPEALAAHLRGVDKEHEASQPLPKGGAS